MLNLMTVREHFLAWSFVAKIPLLSMPQFSKLYEAVIVHFFGLPGGNCLGEKSHGFCQLVLFTLNNVSFSLTCGRRMTLASPWLNPGVSKETCSRLLSLIKIDLPLLRRGKIASSETSPVLPEVMGFLLFLFLWS